MVNEPAGGFGGGGGGGYTLSGGGGYTGGDGGIEAEGGLGGTPFSAGANSAYALALRGGDGVGISLVSLAAVPEPASWKTMILGFGAIGGALRRRRAKSNAGLTAPPSGFGRTGAMRGIFMPKYLFAVAITVMPAMPSGAAIVFRRARPA